MILLGPLPLTAAQQGVVDALRLWPASPDYVLAEYTELIGPLDPHRWQEAIHAMVAATPAQRVRLVRNDDAVMQVIDTPEAVPIDEVDVSGEPHPEAAARKLLAADAVANTDPFAAITTRHILLRLGPQRLWWYHRAHHVALDGYGFALCAADVVRRYRGDAADGDKHAVAYRTLIDADQRYNSSESCRADRDYWHHLLTGSQVAVQAAREGTSTSGVVRAGGPMVGWGPPDGLPMPLLFLTAVAVHTARARRTREVVLGVPVMNRLGMAVARTPGMILNVIALPITVHDDSSVGELAREIGKALAGASRHGRYRHERLRRELGRIGGGRSLFGPVVNVMPFDYSVDIDGVHSRTHNVLAGPVEDLAFQVYLRDGTVELFCDGAASRHTSDEVGAHAEQVAQLASAMAAAPNVRVGQVGREVRVLSRPSRGTVEQFAATRARLAAQGPSAPAIVRADQQLTRAELAAEVGRRAHELACAGVVLGDIVVMNCDDRLDEVVTALAVQELGGAHAVPPNGAFGEVLAQLEDSGVAAVRYDGQQVRRISGPSHGGLRGGYLVATSGSTGRQKWVRVSGHALDCFVADARQAYGWGTNDRVAALAPLHTDTSIEEVFVALGTGATIVLPAANGPFTPAEILEHAAVECVSILDLPTSLWHEAVPLVAADPAVVPKSLRQIVVGGEEVSAVLVQRWRAVAGRVEVIDSYGPSEAAVVNLAGRLSAAQDAGIIGRPLNHTGALICSHPDASGVGAHGELVLFGPVIAEGYLDGQIGGFTEVVVDEQRYPAFATGDLVSVADAGRVRFHGRSDDMVKIGSRRVHLRSVEDALVLLPGVREAMVVRRGRYGLVSYVVGDDLDPDALRAALRNQFPADWVPSEVIESVRLPRGANVKVDRNADDGRASNSLETLVGNVLAEVTGHRVGSAENIFDAGVTSMQAVALAGRLSAATGTRVTVDHVLDAGTRAALAALLGTGTRRPFDLATELQSLRATVHGAGTHALVSAAAGPGPRLGSGPILVTGGSGYVGRRLLARLADSEAERLVVPVRADHHAAAVEKLVGLGDSTLNDQLRRGVQEGRIVITPRPVADVVHDPAVEFSSIVHGAARISAVAPYAALRADNVELVAVVADAANSRGVPLLFLSTATTCGRSGALADPDHMPIGYARTKCVAEHLLVQRSMDAGWPVAVARLPRVLPAGPADAREEDFLHLLARVCARIGQVPDTDLTEPMASVDAVVEGLVRLLPVTVTGTVFANLWSGSVPVRDVLGVGAGAAPMIPVSQWAALVTDTDLPDADRAAALTWARLQLSGFHQDWSQVTDGSVPPSTATQAAHALGTAALWK